MKKIMFNDRYGLTQAVLDGRKTMTRRIIPIDIFNACDFKYFDGTNYKIFENTNFGRWDDIRNYAAYKIGEVVAIAQSYNNSMYNADTEIEIDGKDYLMCETKGWDNKMFVRARLMPHRIKITNVRVERLQDISDEDCMKEGIIKKGEFFGLTNVGGGYNTARGMFEWLINKISGEGTWKRNLYVFVYEFRLFD